MNNKVTYRPSRIWINLLAVGVLFSCITPEEETILENNVLQWVDPMIGTGFHGHTFPGPVWPHGQIQLSPDTHIMGWDASSGYHHDDTTLYGFSHNHLSGTGIGDMGDFLFLPFTGDKAPQKKPVGTLDHRLESAEVGYYRLQVKPWNIAVELTANERSGWHRYTYPEEMDAQFMLDLSHILQPNWGHTLLESSLTIVDEYTVQGFRLTKGWAENDPLWFYAKFSQPIKQISSLQGEDIAVDTVIEGNDLVAFLNFGKLSDPLIISVSISAVDQSGAQNNLAIATDNLTFDQVVEANRLEWTTELQQIQIESKDTAIMMNFYTGLYHTMIAPLLYGDADGRYRGMDQEIHTSTGANRYSAYSLWDTYRSWFPLMTIIQPERAKEWVYDLHQHSVEGGILPKWPLNGNYTGTMVGYPSVSVISDMMAKDLLDSLEMELLMSAYHSSRWRPDFVERFNVDQRAVSVMPRQIFLKEKYGFVPADLSTESVSYGLEMAYYDWCIAQMANRLGVDSIANSYTKKGKAYQFYFDPETNFMRGKNQDGSWKENFDPRYSSHTTGDFVEGNSWQWTPTVPHDIPGLATLMGGKAALGIWLDSLFNADPTIIGEDKSADITGLIGQYAHGNEPSHHIPFMYQYTDRPWRTQEVLNEILYNMYQPTPEGIIGNEDCGQMSAWYVLNALGIYQVTVGKPTYQIGRPIIDKAAIKLDGGVFTIEVINQSKDNKYVDEVRLNGERISPIAINYQDFAAGNTLSIRMKSEP